MIGVNRIEINKNLKKNIRERVGAEGGNLNEVLLASYMLI